VEKHVFSRNSYAYNAQMNLSSLNTFIEVVHRGSFSAVARDHNVSPSSVSRTIAALEEELGIRLFQRSTRRLELTEAGSLYFDQIEPSVGEIEQAGHGIAEFSGIPQGTLRITAAVGFGQIAVAPLLPAFSARYPKINFDLLLTNEKLDLLAERIDLAIRMGPPSDYSYVGTKLFDESFIVCANPSYLEKHGQPQLPEEIAEHDCLHFLMAEFAQWSFHRENSQTKVVKVRSKLRVANSVILRDCAKAGMGITLLPYQTIKQELDNGELIHLFPNYTITIFDFITSAWLMYPTRNQLPLKVRVFVDFMKTQFHHWPDAYKLAASEPEARIRVG
jgi:DNA-binding transcriptional LysR family regulator